MSEHETPGRSGPDDPVGAGGRPSAEEPGAIEPSPDDALVLEKGPEDRDELGVKLELEGMGAADVAAIGTAHDGGLLLGSGWVGLAGDGLGALSVYLVLDVKVGVGDNSLDWMTPV